MKPETYTPLPCPTIIVAPDKFKGTLSAAEAADAIVGAIAPLLPGVRFVAAEMADGGEGTSRILAGADGHCRSVGAVDAAGRPMEAVYYTDATHREAFIDSADVIGMKMMADVAPEPLRWNSYGLGLALGRLIERYDAVTLSVGGTATVDGGIGLLQALGARFYDAEGRLLDAAPDCGGGARDRHATLGLISRVAAADWSGMRAESLRRRLTILVDVDVPMVAYEGLSSLSFAPQKGVRADEVPLLADALSHFAELLPGDCPDKRNLSGAGGALGAALQGLGCRTELGAPIVAKRLEGIIDDCRPALIITGEGHYDEQSLAGKVVGTVTQLASRRGIPALVVCGTADLGANRIEGCDKRRDIPVVATNPAVVATMRADGAPLSPAKARRDIALAASAIAAEIRRLMPV